MSEIRLPDGTLIGYAADSPPAKPAPAGSSVGDAIDEVVLAVDGLVGAPSGGDGYYHDKAMNRLRAAVAALLEKVRGEPVRGALTGTGRDGGDDVV